MTQAEKNIKTAQIGQCGVLLLQYRLLSRGVESAPMTTDSGVDLVAYSTVTGNAVTIQVKANQKPKPGGGKGKEALDWWVSTKCPAQYIAFVDLSSGRIWMLTKAEVATAAQQKSGGKYHFYLYIKDDVKTRTGKDAHCSQFEKFLLENRIQEIFEVCDESLFLHECAGAMFQDIDEKESS